MPAPNGHLDPLKTVNLGQQVATRVSPGGIQIKRRDNVTHGKTGIARVCIDRKRCVIGAEIRCSATGMHIGNSNVRWHGTTRAEFTGNDRSVRRALVVRCYCGIETGDGMIPRKHVMVGRSVVRIGVCKRAD